MPALRLSMRQIRELFRLKFASQLPTSDLQIAAHLGVARSTVAEDLERARAAGLSWPLPLDLGDADLEERLFARPNIRPGARRRVEPAWAAVHRELKRPGVTLMILWEEYRTALPEGYACSRFCELYRAFQTRLAPNMLQTHLAGARFSSIAPARCCPSVTPSPARCAPPNRSSPCWATPTTPTPR